MRLRMKKRRGEGYIDVCVMIVSALLVLAFALQVLPVFIAKQQLDTYAQNWSGKRRSRDASEARLPAEEKR